MANEPDLKLIQIPDPEFPKTDTLVGSGPEYVVLTKADGVTYGMLTEDFKAFLGTVQVQVPKALAPTDPAPSISGVYYPTVTQNEGGTPIVYANAGGISVNTAEGGADHNSMVQLIYDGSSWVKVNVPIDVPAPDLSGLATKEELDEVIAFVDGTGGIDKKITPPVIPGAYIGRTGSLTMTPGSTYWSATEQFIALSGATSVLYEGLFGATNTSLAFYSSDTLESFIQAFPAVNGSITNQEFPTPTGAKFVRATCRTDNLANFSLTLKGYKMPQPEPISISLTDFKISGSSIIYENDAIKESDIVWNDGSTGRVVYSDWDSDNATYKAFTATSVENGKLVTQPAVIFNSEGQITNYPNFVITNI